MAAEDYGDNLMRSRERLEKAGMYGSNQDLSLSSQSKVLQTQKRRWKATDADSKDRKPSPHGDNLNEQPGGYGASFQDKQLFHGAASDFTNQQKDSRAAANGGKDNSGQNRSNTSSLSPDRPKQAPGGLDAGKGGEPQPKKTSLFGGGKKDRLNPFVRKTA